MGRDTFELQLLFVVQRTQGRDDEGDEFLFQNVVHAPFQRRRGTREEGDGRGEDGRVAVVPPHDFGGRLDGPQPANGVHTFGRHADPTEGPEDRTDECRAFPMHLAEQHAKRDHLRTGA